MAKHLADPACIPMQHVGKALRDFGGEAECFRFGFCGGLLAGVRERWQD